MKKLLLALLAFSSITLPKTLVYFVNKTSATVSIQYSANPAPTSSAYGWGTASVAPDQRAQITWLNRDSGIKSGKTYEFHQKINLPGGVYVTFAQRLKGTAFGSDIWMSGAPQGQSLSNWYSDKNFTTAPFTIGGRSYTIYAKWLPLKFGDTQQDIEYTLTETGKATSADILKLIQYNIQQRPTSEGIGTEAGKIIGVKSLGERGTLSSIKLPAALKQFNPDVVTVNEAFTEALRPDLITSMRKIGLFYHTNVLNQSTKTFGWSGGVMIFSRYPITKTKELVYKNFAGIDKNAAKGVLYAQINKEGKLYNIFATHTNASYTFKGKTRLPMNDEGRKARAGQFKELAQFIKDQQIPANQPVIIVGDMNVDMISEKGQSGDEYTNMITTLNATVPALTGHKYTLDQYSNKWVDPDDGPPQYLDFVMYSNAHQKPKKSYNKAMCLKADGRNVCSKTGEDLSDHYPVLAEFDFSTSPVAGGG